MEHLSTVISIDNLGFVFKTLRTIVILIIVSVLFNIVFNKVKNKLLKSSRTKKQKSNVEIFSKIFKYSLMLLIVLIVIFAYSGSLTGLGIGIGLFSAALGWALQKPITGIAAWIMIVVRRPFEIGDRIIIGDVRGDVDDISLTHIYLKEIGGIVGGEENSGRTIMVPNSTMFEKNIINYTLENDHVLDKVTVPVTYESDLEKSMKIVKDSAIECLKEFKEIEKEPVVRIFFQPNGVDVQVRYFAPTRKLQEVSSEITKEIFNIITKTKNVHIAYPHLDIVYNKKPI
jgi:small-conductance mechanosensitive channel